MPLVAYHCAIVLFDKIVVCTNVYFLTLPNLKVWGFLLHPSSRLIIANPLFGYVHKRTLPARPHLKRFT